MTNRRWQIIANACAVVAVAALVLAWAGYVECVLDVADGMRRELNPLTEAHLEVPIARATEGVDEIPQAWGDRAKLAHPVCIERNPIADNLIYYAMFVFGVLGMWFARRQATLGRRSIDLDNVGSGRADPSGHGEIRGELDVGDVDVGLSKRDREILEGVGDINTRDESLMIYIQRQADAGDEESEDVPPDVDGFFCPPGYADAPVLYVDPDHEFASDDLAGEDPVDEPERPFETIEGAIAMARQLREEGHDGVMIRLLPGVYPADFSVPDRVVICNHRLPLEGTIRARLKWLIGQGVDHPDCVTLLASPNTNCAVQFDKGVNQGIFGCHIVGREDIKQAGAIADGSRSLAFVNCSFEGFSGGALRVQDAGTELAGGAVLVRGCRFHRNEAGKGGAIFARRSSVSVSDCIIEHNRGTTGGAIYGVDLRAPLMLVRSRIAYNRAQLPEPPTVDPEETPLEAWQNESGLGGGVYLRGSKLKLSGSELVENGASVAGGGIALLASKAIVERDENRGRFARNRSRLGAGIALFGWPDHDSTLKCTDALFEKNVATVGGGGLAAIGLSVVQCIETEFRDNEIGEPGGFGGAVACWMGGELLAMDTEFFENKSAGSGGAIAVINARMSLKNQCRIRSNIARKSGGGIYAVSTGSKIAAGLVDRKVLKIPFAVLLEDIKISNNASRDLGGGLRGGNELGITTLPMGFKLSEDVVFQLNRTKSQQEHGDDVWVVWAGEVKATDREPPKKLVLR
jgi:hypothetical protein